MRYEQVRTTALQKRHGIGRVHIAAVVAALLALLLAGGALQRPSGARAAGGPIIHWDSHMIYPGQNNGYPWGPVGETASVQGANFPPGLQLRLVLAQGDSNSSPAICRMPVATVSTVTTAGSGQFSQNFSWPVAAGQVNQQYSICALLAASGNVISHQDDGPFTVLSSSPPAINISTAAVTAGNTVTVTGQNWVPPQQVNVVIASCADCGAQAITNGTVGSTGLNSGSFSITLTIPAGAGSGNYAVNALTSSGLDANHTSGVRSLAVTALAAVPTPTPTAAPSPTVKATTTATVTTTPTVTVTTTPTNANTSASNINGDNGNSGLMIGLVVSTVLVLLAIAAVILFIYRQRSSKRRAPQGGAAQNYSQPLPPGVFSPNNGYPTQQDNFSMPSGALSNYNYPAQLGNFGLPANDLSESPTQFVQQAGSLPGYSQSMLSQSYGQPTGATALLCMNCGRTWLPGDTHCAGCGLPVGTRKPNVPF